MVKEHVSRRFAVTAIALAAFAVPAIACSGGNPEPTEAAPTPEPSPTASPTPLPPVPTAAPEPTPTPAVTPTPDTESVGHYVAAYSLLSRGEYRQAEQRFTIVIELEPDFARGWDGRGQARMLNGENEEAIFDFDRAIMLKPNLWQAYGHRAVSRMNTGDVEGAKRDAERAIEGDPELVEPYIVLGRTNAALDNLDEAEFNFTKAIELAPDEGATHWWRGRFYRDYAESPLRSLEDLNTAIELEPARAVIYLDRAMLLIRYWGNEKDIRADLEEARSLAQDPLLPNVLDAVDDLEEALDSRASS